MNRRASGRWEWSAPAPKLPPPAHGIKAAKYGTSWWGQRWTSALEAMSAEYANRLPRGKTYARAGRVHDLVIDHGDIKALVTGSRPFPYEVHVAAARLNDQVWDRAILAMAQSARFAADLLAGRMPEQIDAVFKEGGASLFPADEADLSTECDCPDWANPCKHIAAVHFVVGAALDRDPFLLFELRGRTKEQVLEALRAARADSAEPQTGAAGAPGSGKRNTLGRDDGVLMVDPAQYDRREGRLPNIRLEFKMPATSSALLKQLGLPDGWSGKPPSELLGPVVRSASEYALRIAMAERDVDHEPPKLRS